MNGNKVRSLVGFSRKKSCVKDVAPKGWLSTHEVAAAAGVTRRSVRALLHREGVKCVKVKQGGGSPLLYWESKGVKRFLSVRPAVKEGVPTGMCCTHEACCILGVGHSSLSRYEQKGYLQGGVVRMATASGVRALKVYCRAHVRGLLKRLQAREQSRRRRSVREGQRRWGRLDRRRVFVPQE